MIHRIFIFPLAARKPSTEIQHSFIVTQLSCQADIFSIDFLFYVSVLST